MPLVATALFLELARWPFFGAAAPTPKSLRHIVSDHQAPAFITPPPFGRARAPVLELENGCFRNSLQTAGQVPARKHRSYSGPRMKDTRQTPPPRGEDNGKEKDSGSTEGPKADGGLRVVAQGSIQRGHPTKLVSLQDRLNSISFDFSMEDVKDQSRAEGNGKAQANVNTPTKENRALVRHALYRRRKHPPSALCMPKHQRPQGCAPLLPTDREGEPAVGKIGVVGGVNRSGVASGGGDGGVNGSPEVVSDLPCVTKGKCPLPAFRCPKGHIWEADGRPVCFYCPVCADSRVTMFNFNIQQRTHQKRDLDVMKKLASDRGGECLSTIYAGMHGKLRFRCAEGHEWRSSPANLAYKHSWCPTCAGLRGAVRKRLTTSDMRYTARQFGGEFISSEYKGAGVKHEWRCHRGHHFWQTPNNVRRSAGGRRIATFCKRCTVIDKQVIMSSVLAGMDEKEAKSTAEDLRNIGAMPTRKFFLPRRRKGPPLIRKKRTALPPRPAPPPLSP